MFSFFEIHFFVFDKNVKSRDKNGNNVQKFKGHEKGRENKKNPKRTRRVKTSLKDFKCFFLFVVQIIL